MRLWEWMIQLVAQIGKHIWIKRFSWSVETMVKSISKKDVSKYQIKSPYSPFFINHISFELGKIRMMPGTYSYRFQCVIPPSVPTSVEGSIGHIRYSACLNIDIPMFQSKEFQQTFYVLKAIDLNNHPILRVSFFFLRQILHFFHKNPLWNWRLVNCLLLFLFIWYTKFI